jgi:Protein of unknown function (DUF3105)
VARSSGTGARQTKAERKEAARREREEIRRRIERQRRNRRIGIVAVAVVAALAVVAFVILRPTQAAIPSPAEAMRQSASQARAAGCDEVATTPPYSPKSQDRTHIGSPGSGVLSAPPLSSYPTTPPASGPHDPTPWNAGVQGSPPPIYQVIHSMEHAAAVVWYDPSAPSEDIARLKTFYRDYLASTDGAGAKIIVAPYSYPEGGSAGRLPGGVEMALVAWHRMQTCAQVSIPAAFGFTSRYALPPFPGQHYRGAAPEPQTAI